MSLLVNQTSINEDTSFFGSGGGGGGASTFTSATIGQLSVSSMVGTSDANGRLAIDSAFLDLGQGSILNNIKLYADPTAGGFNVDPAFVSTTGIRVDYAGQIGRISQTLATPGPTPGFGGMVLQTSSEINLGSVKGTAIWNAGGTQLGPFFCSTINGGTPATTELFSTLFAANPSLSTIVY